MRSPSSPTVPDEVTDTVDTASPLLTDPTSHYATGDYYAITPCAMAAPVPLPGGICEPSLMGRSTLDEDCITPSPSPTNTIQPCAIDPNSTLADFGIVLEGTWTPTEETEILIAARETGRALCLHRESSNSVVEAFRIVLQGKNELDAYRTIRLFRGGTGGCRTYDLVNSTESASISCSETPEINRYTIIHEFGHVFDNLTDGLFREQIRDPDGTGSSSNRLNNSLNEFVMGIRGFDLINGSRVDWRRSEPDIDNGWGSAALWNGLSYWGPYTTIVHNTPPTPDSTGELSIPQLGPCGDNSPIPTPTIIYPTPNALPYNFQQNPCIYPDWETTSNVIDELYEASADMFLNWVYWKNTSGESGFQNTIWRSGGCYPTGCPEQTADSGDTRGNWMNSTMTNLLDLFDWPT